MKRIRDYVLESGPAESGSSDDCWFWSEKTSSKKHEAAGDVEINDGIWGTNYVSVLTKDYGESVILKLIKLFGKSIDVITNDHSDYVWLRSPVFTNSFYTLWLFFWLALNLWAIYRLGAVWVVMLGAAVVLRRGEHTSLCCGISEQLSQKQYPY